MPSPRLALTVLATVGLALFRSPPAAADSCVTLEGSVLANGCRACMEVTVRELRAAGDQAAGAFASEGRKVRVEAGKRATLPGAQRTAIVDVAACR